MTVRVRDLHEMLLALQSRQALMEDRVAALENRFELYKHNTTVTHVLPTTSKPHPVPLSRPSVTAAEQSREEAESDGYDDDGAALDQINSTSMVFRDRGPAKPLRGVLDITDDRPENQQWNVPEFIGQVEREEDAPHFTGHPTEPEDHDSEEDEQSGSGGEYDDDGYSERGHGNSRAWDELSVMNIGARKY